MPECCWWWSVQMGPLYSLCYVIRAASCSFCLKCFTSSLSTSLIRFFLLFFLVWLFIYPYTFTCLLWTWLQKAFAQLQIYVYLYYLSRLIRLHYLFALFSSNILSVFIMLPLPVDCYSYLLNINVFSCVIYFPCCFLMPFFCHTIFLLSHWPLQNVLVCLAAFS